MTAPSRADICFALALIAFLAVQMFLAFQGLWAVFVLSLVSFTLHLYSEWLETR